jgi:N-acetylglucosaminyldiphosphoundecaprenol N-acetyl-beta-D-mannosaminyltransferase
MRKLLIILGCPIDDVTMEEALDRLDELIVSGRASGQSHQIVTVNVDFVVQSLKDPELRLILQEADLSTADGMPLVWGAKLLGAPLRERVTGADMIPALAGRAAQKGYSMYFLGAAPGVAQRAANILQERHPGLKVAGVFSPPNRSVLDMDTSVVDGIKVARPDILLVAFGNPKQEKWINMHARELSVPVMIGIGGTLDFIAGATRRAPAWMQRRGLEWIYRLSQEPRRLWKRYVVDSWHFGVFFVWQWWLMRGGKHPAAALPAADAILVEGHIVLSLAGRLDISNRAEFISRVDQALAENPHLILNLEKASFLDSAGLGALVDAAKRARLARGDLWLAAVPEAVHRTLALTRLDRLFEIFPTVEDALHRKANAPEKKVSPEQRANWQVVAAPRRLDAESAPELAPQWEAHLTNNPRLVVDLSNTVFLTSAGLSILIRLHRRAKELDGELRLAGCGPDVRRVINLTKLDSVLALYLNVDEASR